MFGRRKRVDEEAAREAERRALFEELAKRPDTVCPFLGLASARAEYRPEPNGEHRCYAFGDPAPLADEQQLHVCLERGYSNCPRYLRGVLVIPSEELEALRRPQPHVPPPPPPPPRPVQEGGGRRRWLLVGPLIVLLLAAIGVGSWYLVTRPGPIAIVTSPSPSPTVSAVASSSLPASVRPSTSGGTPTPEPTPTAGDHFAYYEVGVAPTTYTLFRVDPAAGIVASIGVRFAAYSRAPVQPLRTADGLVYWQTTQGGYVGYSYVPGRSGTFQLREVFLSPTGERHVYVIPAAQATVLPSGTPAPS